MLKKVINFAAGRFGCRVVDARNVHDERGFVRRLRDGGFVPKTVLDVGVAYGTPYLYNGFPEAHFILIDPTRESLPHMRKWAKIIDAEIHNCGLGAERKKSKIRTRQTIQHSTLLEDTSAPELSGEYIVDIFRYDDLTLSAQAPALAKIDVEGYEFAVLQGMGDRLSDYEIFVIETSVRSMYKGGHDMLEILTFMERSGYEVFDVAGITRRPFDNTIHQFNICLARRGSVFCERRWS